jgi:ribosomal protein S18 acetylase RimI-like enzyme
VRPAAIMLRPTRAEDETFLRRLYASTREAELAPLPWTDAQKETFLAQQFDAQDLHYRTHFPAASFEVIEREGAPRGRLTIDRRDDEICVLDIALVPEQRGMGIGGALLRGLLAEAEAKGQRVVLHVQHANPALRLYRRLGFRALRDEGIYLLLAWCPLGSVTQQKIDS